MFASLRANDLIWPYVVKGYLKGQAPPAFDLLYWNSDDTNLPGPDVLLVRPQHLPGEQAARARRHRAVRRAGRPGAVDVPAFVYASKEDHIVPWKTAYASTQLLSGDTTFVLGASGHIAGVINPPAKKKRNYWTGRHPGTGRRGRTRPARRRPGPLVRGRREGPGQLVAGLGRVAGPALRAAGRRPQEARQRRVLRDRGGARQLRQGIGVLTDHRYGAGPARSNALGGRRPTVSAPRASAGPARPEVAAENRR